MLRCSDDPARSTYQVPQKRSTYDELNTSKVGRETIAYDLTGSNKRHKTCGEVPDESLPSGSDTMAALGGLPPSVPDSIASCEVVAQLTRSVVSLSLVHRGVNVFSCGGFPVVCKPPYIRILTSSNLVTTLRSKTKPGHMDICVRDASNNVAGRWLEEQDFDHGIAFLIAIVLLDVCAVNLHAGVEFLPTTNNLLAIQFTDTGAALVSTACEDGKVLCNDMSKASDGRPLFDYARNFIGINLFSHTTGRCEFIHSSEIIERMRKYEAKNEFRDTRRLNSSKFRPAEPGCEKRRRMPIYT